MGGASTALMRTANEQLVLAALDARSVHDELETAIARQRSFMAVLAHELRNPLAPMRNVSALLARVQPGDAILPRLQDIIERQIMHMARMIDDLVDVSRAQTGSLSLSVHEADLITLVTNAIATCQPAMVLRQQRLRSACAAYCPTRRAP
jgi:diguanylate cyclase